MRKLLIVLIAVCSVVCTQAQSSVYDSSIMPDVFENSSQVVKPLGTEIGVGYRSIGDSNALQYGYISSTINDVGVGATLYRASFSIANFYSFMGNFGYRIHLDESTILFGLNVGADYLGLDYSKIKIYNDIGVNESLSDTYLNKKEGDFDFNFGGGIYYYTEKYFLGVSAPRLISSENWKTMYNLTTGYNWDLNDYFRWVNLARVRYLVNGNYRIDITSKIQYDNNDSPFSYASLGFSYSLKNSVSFFTFLDVPKTNIELGLGYSFFMNDYKKYSPSGVFEFQLKYSFRAS